MGTDDQIHATQIEALLFAEGGMSKIELTKYLGITPEELERAIAVMRERGGERGVVLVDDGTTLELRTAPSCAALIERIRKEEYNRDIGRAGLEVLAAVLYKNAQTRAQIDFIRGVNSTQTLRTLTMRGLLRKVTNPQNERSYMYEPTTELLAHLGITKISELPDFEQIQKQLNDLETPHPEVSEAAHEASSEELPETSETDHE